VGSLPFGSASEKLRLWSTSHLTCFFFALTFYFSFCFSGVQPEPIFTFLQILFRNLLRGKIFVPVP
jgi:hypothetical protein